MNSRDYQIIMILTQYKIEENRDQICYRTNS